METKITWNAQTLEGAVHKVEHEALKVFSPIVIGTPPQVSFQSLPRWDMKQDRLMSAARFWRSRPSK